MPLDPWILDLWALEPLRTLVDPWTLEPLELVDPWTLVEPWPLDLWIIGWILEGALCTYIYLYSYITYLLVWVGGNPIPNTVATQRY